MGRAAYSELTSLLDRKGGLMEIEDHMKNARYAGLSIVPVNRSGSRPFGAVHGI